MNHLVDQYFDSLSDKKVAVLGIGVSNRPLIRMLLARGIHVLACDKTPREKLDAEVLELEQAGAVLHVGEGISTMCGRTSSSARPGCTRRSPRFAGCVPPGRRSPARWRRFLRSVPAASSP
ncbi:MAG: hypothetical protein ACLUFI_00770 [Oscillospiraceae bacterium]